MDTLGISNFIMDMKYYITVFRASA